MNENDPRNQNKNNMARPNGNVRRNNGRSYPTSGNSERIKNAHIVRNDDAALNEHYEDMVDGRTGRRMDISSGVNRDKYADLSTFESHGHRKISPEVMRRKKRAALLKKSIPVCAAVLVIIIAIVIYTFAISPARKYKKAQNELELTNYNAAQNIFEKLGSYKDSEKYVKYIDAVMAVESKDYEKAKTLLSELGSFLDSAERLIGLPKESADPEKETAYDSAMKLFTSGDYEGARKAFGKLGNYKDSAAKINECDEKIKNKKYEEACRALENGETERASALFSELGDYKDSKDKLSSIGANKEQQKLAAAYSEAYDIFSYHDYSSAYNAFKALGNYRDSTKYAQYSYAMIFMKDGDLARAEQEFGVAGDFLDAPDMILECRYKRAYSAYENGDYKTAIEYFSELGNYSDSESKLAQIKKEYESKQYETALFTYYNGDLDGALEIFTSLGSYSDAAEWVKKIQAEKQSAKQ